MHETPPDTLRPPCNVAGFEVRHYGEIDSTNTLALATARDNTVFVAESQHSGRGRHGAVWHSARGCGLWMTIALQRPPAMLGFIAALAVRDAILEACRLGDVAAIALKWPNDLLAAGRKVCGVLVEHRVGWSAVGIGLNLSQQAEDFPVELQTQATSLALAFGEAPDADVLLAALLGAYRRRLDVLNAGGQAALFEEWRSALDIEGRTIARDTWIGVVDAVEEDGALRVRIDDRHIRVDAGVIEVMD